MKELWLKMIALVLVSSSFYMCSGTNISSQLNFVDNYHTNHSTVSLYVDPYPNIRVYMGDNMVISVKYNIVCQAVNGSYILKIASNAKSVAFVKSDPFVDLDCNQRSTENGELAEEFNVSGMFKLVIGADLLGRAWLEFYLMNIVDDLLLDTADGEYIVKKYDNFPLDSDGVQLSERRTPAKDDLLLRVLVTVLRPSRTIDLYFKILLYTVIVSITIGMGCKTDLGVVKAVLKRPVAPAIGYFCQYMCMPLIAFGIAKLVPVESTATAFGIFACGFCPGGGISNIYCYILNGDVSLSVTMTTLSSVSALILIPFWMFTLGRTFTDDNMELDIPYFTIMSRLSLFVLPLFIGIAIKYKVQRLAKLILMIIRPISFVSVTILLTFGIYANLYVFRLFSPILILASCLLPYIGYVVGGAVALAFRQPWVNVKTIALETGIQNVIIAYFILVTSLPAPDGDLAAVGPTASAVMTPLPPFIVAVFYTIYNKCKERKDESFAVENPDDLEMTEPIKDIAINSSR